jgi:NitT/TauT family transport system permease protein
VILATTHKIIDSPWFYRLLGYAAVLGAWQLASGRLVAPHLLPSPSSIIGEMVEFTGNGLLVTHFTASFQRIGISLFLVFVLGGLVGIAMGLSRFFENAFRDVLSVMLSIPGLVFVLMFLIIFGLDPRGPIVAIVVTNFAFVAVQVWEGVRSVPTDLIGMASAFQVSRGRMLRKVVLPAIAPFLFTALTYTFALTWKLSMLTELFGGNAGVGFMMRYEFSTFSMRGMLAWALAFFIVAIILERAVFNQMARRFFRWRVESYG